MSFFDDGLCPLFSLPPPADNPKADMWSGFVAVFSVNLIIAAYVVMAFMEDKDEPTTAGGAGQAAWPGMARSKERID